MKRRGIGTVIVFLAAFVFSVADLAYANQQGGQCGVTEKTYTGRITSMNQTGDRIVVNGAEGDKGFVLPDAASNGLRLDEKVAVNYADRDGSLIASSIGAPQTHVSNELEKHFEEEAGQQ